MQRNTSQKKFKKRQMGVGGMENVTVLGFCDVMMQSSNLRNVQNYSNNYIHLLLQLFNICRYGCFSLRFG